MARSAELLALDAFSNAATRVPAYRTLLREAGIRVEEVQSPQDFHRLPVLEKAGTFQRFPIQEMCLDGSLGRPGTVLTSSGHSGRFAFGLTDAEALPATTAWIDDALDFIFGVRSRPTLLINCLPMGVKVPTLACTLAETSVRPDMTIALIRSFGRHFAQVILVGEPAFIKHVLELGQRAGVMWRDHVVHLVLGEEPLAENARRYLGDLLGHDLRQPEKGMAFSSMGVAELGLNLFFEVPPLGDLVRLRRLLHERKELRAAAGFEGEVVPSLFTYDPRRLFVECDADGRLILTTLNLATRIPLIRYATGDQGEFVRLPPGLRGALEGEGLSWDVLSSLPLIAISGRGSGAASGESQIYPEAVKEGLYHDADLAVLTTANFRLVPDPAVAWVRIQLSPGVRENPEIERRFHTAIAHYVRVPFRVGCEAYERFGSGMLLDYERKFDYLGP